MVKFQWYSASQFLVSIVRNLQIRIDVLQIPFHILATEFLLQLKAVAQITDIGACRDSSSAEEVRLQGFSVVISKLGVVVTLRHDILN